MGGKRPDQYRIDPAEGQSTDKKWGPGHEDESIKNEQKSKYEESRVEAREGMIPQQGVNPALQELRDVKMRSREESEQEGIIPQHGVNPALQELREVKTRGREEAERQERQDERSGNE